MAGTLGAADKFAILGGNIVASNEGIMDVTGDYWFGKVFDSTGPMPFITGDGQQNTAPASAFFDATAFVTSNLLRTTTLRIPASGFLPNITGGLEDTLSIDLTATTNADQVVDLFTGSVTSESGNTDIVITPAHDTATLVVRWTMTNPLIFADQDSLTMSIDNVANTGTLDFSNVYFIFPGSTIINIAAQGTNVLTLGGTWLGDLDGGAGHFVLQVFNGGGSIHLDGGWFSDLISLNKGVVGDSMDASCHGLTVRCLAEGTEVQTPTGAVAIESLHVGDTVLLHDFVSGKVRTERLADVRSGVLPAGSLEPRIITIGPDTISPGVPAVSIRCTENHPFLVGDEHVEAGALVARRPGVCSVLHSERPTRVFSLQVAGEGGLVLSGGAIAHTVPALSAKSPLHHTKYAAGSACAETGAKTDLLYHCDGRVWVRCDGSQWVHPGERAGVARMWVPAP